MVVQKKVIYCGYDIFAGCFDVLIESGAIIQKVFLVDCDNKYNFNTYLKDRCLELNIPFTFEKITQKDVKEMQDIGCNLIVSAAYSHKIPVYEGMPRAVNIHPSLLPEGRGPWPLPWVILKKLTESGTTIHKIAERWDIGDILISEKFLVTDNDTLETITEKSHTAAKNTLRELLHDFETYWKHATPQGTGSYWPMPTLKDRTINWAAPLEEIDRVVRAFGNFDSCATFGGKDWIVQSAQVIPTEHRHSFGDVLKNVDCSFVDIAANGGIVRILKYKIDPDFE